jgi:hypothetical protein
MARGKRPNGAGHLYTKAGNYYSRWITRGGGHANRKIGPVRRPGSASGLTRAQAERELQQLMAVAEAVPDPARTVVTRLIIQLRRKGLAARTIRNIASTLHFVFEIAISTRWLRENVCSLVDLPLAKRQRGYPLSHAR